jgi:hypothetical protein
MSLPTTNANAKREYESVDDFKKTDLAIDKNEDEPTGENESTQKALNRSDSGHRILRPKMKAALFPELSMID